MLKLLIDRLQAKTMSGHFCILLVAASNLLMGNLGLAMSQNFNIMFFIFNDTGHDVCFVQKDASYRKKVIAGNALDSIGEVPNPSEKDFERWRDALEVEMCGKRVLLKNLAIPYSSEIDSRGRSVYKMRITAHDYAILCGAN